MTRSRGPNVAWKVTVAFLLPIAVFILGIVLSNLLFKSHIQSESLLTLVNFLVSLTITLLYVLIIRIITKDRNHKSCTKKDNQKWN